jgi:hypothetical protein
MLFCSRDMGLCLLRRLQARHSALPVVHPVEDPESLDLARDREELDRALEVSAVEGFCAVLRWGGRRSRSAMEICSDGSPLGF